MKRILVICILLSGCSTIPRLELPDEKLLTTKVKIDRELLVECEPDLAELRGVNPEDVLDALARSRTIHTTCVNRHRELSGVIRKAFDIKD